MEILKSGIHFNLDFALNLAKRNQNLDAIPFILIKMGRIVDAINVLMSNKKYDQVKNKPKFKFKLEISSSKCFPQLSQ